MEAPANTPKPKSGQRRYSGYHELSPKSVISTMAGVATVMFMAALDQTVVSTAMPRLIADLHGFEHYSGVVTAYMITSTIAIPIVGKLSDFYGRKLFLLIGVVIFVGASALCGLAHSMLQLILFRGLQGIGAGITQAMAFTTVADLFPPARRGKISGALGAVYGLASVLGPALGGFLTDYWGWRYVFYINLPIGIMAFCLLYGFFPQIRSANQTKPSIDYAGAIALTFTLTPLLLALSWGREKSADAATIALMFCFGIIMLPILLWIELRAKEPVIPLKLFKNRIVWTSLVASSLVSIGMFGTLLFVPLFIQAVIGTTATRSGAIVMPMMLTVILSSVVTGQLISYLGKYRTIAIIGVYLACLGMFLLSLMTAETPYRDVVRNMMIIGVGLGMTIPIFTLAVQNAVEIQFVGIATATVQFIRSIGGTLGAAIFGSVLTNRYVPAFHHALPADILARIPPEQLQRLNDPQDFMMTTASQDFAQSIHTAARLALAQSLNRVFLLGAVLLFIAGIITFFIKDLPLRKSNRPSDVVPAA